MSASTVMAALAVVLPDGTPVQAGAVAIESVLEILQGPWPALVIYVDETDETRASTGKKRELHNVSAALFDAWDATTRTVAQMAADSRAILETMKANVRANRTLTVGGVAHAIRADEHIKTLPVGIVSKIAVGGKPYELPFPMYVATMSFEGIEDLWITG